MKKQISSDIFSTNTIPSFYLYVMLLAELEAHCEVVNVLIKMDEEREENKRGKAEVKNETKDND